MQSTVRLQLTGDVETAQYLVWHSSTGHLNPTTL
jgi:hypothetical protein